MWNEHHQNRGQSHQTSQGEGHPAPWSLAHHVLWLHLTSIFSITQILIQFTAFYLLSKFEKARKINLHFCASKVVQNCRQVLNKFALGKICKYFALLKVTCRKKSFGRGKIKKYCQNKEFKNSLCLKGVRPTLFTVKQVIC